MSNELYQLRDYQQTLIDNIFKAWEAGHQSVLAYLPTGAGKTICFSAIAATFIDNVRRVLVIAHLEELITQAAAELAKITGEEIGIIKADYVPNPNARIQVASIQTLVRRELPNIGSGLVIIDEAHHAASPTYSQIISYYREQESRILGVSATPNRPDGRSLCKLHKGIKGFDVLVTGPDTAQLIAQNYLVPFKIFAAERLLDAASSGVQTKGGDYDETELSQYVRKTLVLGDVIQTWHTHAFGLRTVVFAVSVPHAHELAAAFSSAGITAQAVDGQTPSGERTAILQRFASGKTLVLCQYSLLVEGVDVPGIQAVVWSRPTQSLVVWLQGIGRGLRPFPGKQELIIIDHTLNHIVHPWPNTNIAWSLEPVKIKPDKNTFTCTSCNHVFRPTADEQNSGAACCPSCGTSRCEPYQLQEPTTAELEEKMTAKHQRIIEVLPANFIEVSPQPDPNKMRQVHRLFKIQKECGYKKGWLIYRLQELEKELQLGLIEWQEVGRLLGYNPNWALMQWREYQLKENSQHKH